MNDMYKHPVAPLKLLFAGLLAGSATMELKASFTAESYSIYCFLARIKILRGARNHDRRTATALKSMASHQPPQYVRRSSSHEIALSPPSSTMEHLLSLALVINRHIYGDDPFTHVARGGSCVHSVC